MDAAHRFTPDPLPQASLVDLTDVQATDRHPAAASVTKRALDIVAASLGLILAAPLIALVAIIIRMTSPGPALFRQARVGRDGRDFTILKLRSMRAGDDTAHRAHALSLIVDADAGPADNGTYKLTDPRVTRIGRIIRATSIDELPQLWNVIRGDMSLVGPRPMLDWEFEHVCGRHRDRVLARPGMTGLWQVSGRSDLSTHEMLDLDVQYLDSWSWWRDVGILARTPFALVSR